jgi:hypothetical protein
MRANRYLKHSSGHRDDLWKVGDIPKLLLHVTQEQDGGFWEDSPQAKPGCCHFLGLGSDRVRWAEEVRV